MDSWTCSTPSPACCNLAHFDYSVRWLCRTTGLAAYMLMRRLWRLALRRIQGKSKFESISAVLLLSYCACQCITKCTDWSSGCWLCSEDDLGVRCSKLIFICCISPDLEDCFPDSFTDPWRLRSSNFQLSVEINLLCDTSVQTITSLDMKIDFLLYMHTAVDNCVIFFQGKTSIGLGQW